MSILAADLFCGAGGSSTGLVQAAQERGRGLELLAVSVRQAKALCGAMIDAGN